MNLIEEGFNIKYKTIAGVDCQLIYPKDMGTTWTKDNLIYRSNVSTVEGQPVSLGFRKFWNWDEQPQLAKPPINLKKCNLIDKVDGSLLIVSYFKNERIIRTRGTFDAFELENGNEINYLIQKYPLAFDNKYLRGERISMLYEWTTPTNRIVLNYGDEPQITLVGCINHSGYSYMSQKDLDILGDELNVQRPKRWNFTDVEDIFEFLKTVKNMEGICVYYNNDQDIKKLKSDDYLIKHKLKSQVNQEFVLDWVLSSANSFNYKTVTDEFIKTFDWEIYEMSRGYISNILDADKKVQDILSNLYIFHHQNKNLIRKEYALAVQRWMPERIKQVMLYHMYDNKPVDKKYMKTLYIQIIGGL